LPGRGYGTTQQPAQQFPLTTVWKGCQVENADGIAVAFYFGLLFLAVFVIAFWLALRSVIQP
jgi:hypothetical protein